uniref:dihydropyrimidinase n=1 Tax=Auxenochlorella protothecoides TaxID=3075 RepID=A0A1D1ZXI2_AUXPR
MQGCARRMRTRARCRGRTRSWSVNFPWRALVITTALLAFAAPSRGSEILIKGGTVVNAEYSVVADVLIRDEIIVAVKPNIQLTGGMQVLDATGKLVMPGGIDPHTHLDMPFMGQVSCDDFASGQRAALAGGTTMHIDFVLPVEHDLLAGLEAWRKKARHGVMDYGFHMAVTSWSNKVSRDMATVAAQGINSFKFFMAYKGSFMVEDDALLRGMERCAALGALAQVHAENGAAVAWGQERVAARGVTAPHGHALSRPAALEDEATGRAIRLAGLAGARLYVVHVMSGGAADEIAAARRHGQRVVGETVISALALTEDSMWDSNFTVAAAHVMSPPIRSTAHRASVRQALAGGVLQIVGTDHAVFNSTQKAAGKEDFRAIPNGVNGIEERLHVVWETMVNSGASTPSDFVRATSTAAARAFNIYPRKGSVAPGSDADVIVLDPSVRHVISAATHHSAVDVNVYEGMEVTGKVVLTLSRGRLVWDGTNLNVTAGSGRFIPMPLFQSSRPDDLGAVVPGTAPTCPSGHRVKHADTQRVATLTYA